MIPACPGGLLAVRLPISSGPININPPGAFRIRAGFCVFSRLHFVIHRKNGKEWPFTVGTQNDIPLQQYFHAAVAAINVKTTRLPVPAIVHGASNTSCNAPNKPWTSAIYPVAPECIRHPRPDDAQV